MGQESFSQCMETTREITLMELSQCSPSTPTYTVFISPFIVLTQTGLTVVVLPGMPMNNIIGRVQYWLSGNSN